MKKNCFNCYSAFICASFLFYFCAVFFLTSCNSKNTIQKLQELEEGVNHPTSEEELKDAIKKYERRVNDIMVAENRIGIWYKILGSRYMDQKMYKKALECFKNALEYYPENQNLFYQTGLAASLVAKNALDFNLTGANMEKHRYYELAVSAYKRAVEIDPKNAKAAYALSILYVFELGTPSEAVPLLETIIEAQKKPIDHMFLLARAYFMTGQNEKSIAMYKRIMESTSSTQKKAEAEQNLQFVQGRTGIK